MAKHLTQGIFLTAVQLDTQFLYFGVDATSWVPLEK